jgi:hypothetical protein
LVHPFTDDVTGGGRRAGKPPQQRDPRDVTMRSTPPTTGPGWPRVQDTTWPLQSHLELGALPTAVPCARLHSRLVAGEWGLPGLAEVVELIVSELTTNAAAAAHGLPGIQPVRLWLRSDGRRILVQVWDASPQTPVRRTRGPTPKAGAACCWWTA